MLPEEWPPINPIGFFQLNIDCLFLEAGDTYPSSEITRTKYRFPDTASLCGEVHFADFSMGWNTLGLEAYVHIHQPYHTVSFPYIARGDSIELFIDTRDIKTSGYNTRFCHHFFFLPEPVEGVSAQEITRFRTEDAHELCNPQELQVKSFMDKKGYKMHILIPSSCLHGYDPEQIDRMGFTYRINRAGGAPQHLSVTSREFPIEQQPSLWSSIRLKR